MADEHVAAAGQQGAHVGTARVPPLFEGLTIEQVGDRFEGDLMGGDASAWPGLLASSIEEAHAVVAQPGALERTVHLSFGNAFGQEYVMQLTADLATYSWDLARATGQDDRLDAGAVARLLPGPKRAPTWSQMGMFGPTNRQRTQRPGIRPPARPARPQSLSLARNRPGRGPGASPPPSSPQRARPGREAHTDHPVRRGADQRRAATP